MRPEKIDDLRGSSAIMNVPMTVFAFNRTYPELAEERRSTKLVLVRMSKAGERLHLTKYEDGRKVGYPLSFDVGSKSPEVVKGIIEDYRAV